MKSIHDQQQLQKPIVLLACELLVGNHVHPMSSSRSRLDTSVHGFLGVIVASDLISSTLREILEAQVSSRLQETIVTQTRNQRLPADLTS